MRAMILCAGLSTRLAPLGAGLPKPLLPVCDIPIVRYGIALLVGHDIRDIVINLHHHGHKFRDELGDGADMGARIQYSDEPQILGTGGGLKRALPLLDPDGTDEPFLSLNGKLIFDLDIAALLAEHERDPDVLGRMVVRREADAEAWGAVKVDSVPARVRDVLGQGQHMFCGVHLTRPSVVARLPDGEACMIRQGYLPWIREGGEVAAFDAGDVYFAEHSVPSRYLEGNRALLRDSSLRHPPGPLRGVASDAHIHSTAVLRHPVKISQGAHIGEHAVIGPDTVIGAHAIVEAGSDISGSVVWPRVRVTGVVKDAVVTREATVPAL